jgi:hypothetical protein
MKRETEKSRDGEEFMEYLADCADYWLHHDERSLAVAEICPEYVRWVEEAVATTLVQDSEIYELLTKLVASYKTLFLKATGAELRSAFKYFANEAVLPCNRELGPERNCEDLFRIVYLHALTAIVPEKLRASSMRYHPRDMVALVQMVHDGERGAKEHVQKLQMAYAYLQFINPDCNSRETLRVLTIEFYDGTKVMESLLDDEWRELSSSERNALENRQDYADSLWGVASINLYASVDDVVYSNGN